MAIYVGSPSGSVIELKDLDVSRTFEGTEVSALVTGDIYRLTISSEAVDHVNVESVRDNGTLRWIKRTDGDVGTTTPTPAAVPKSLGDGTLDAGWLPPSLATSAIYVSPDGDDDNDGTSWELAKETIYEGIIALNLLGGGTLYVGDNSDVGGPADSQGIRLRFDKLPSFFFPAEGFLPHAPMVIEGCGRSYAGFTPGVMARINGGGSGPFNPMVWIVGTLFAPITIRNIVNTTRGANGFIIGADFDRELDGTIKHLDVSSATRTSTTTVFTIDVGGVTPLVVTRASRTDEVTTLTIPNPGLPYPPWRQGVPFRLTSGDADFDSGDFDISLTSNHEGSNVTWTISYEEPGEPDVADKAVTGCSVQTHGCVTGELIDLISSNAHWKSTQFYVDSATVDTVTVTDVFGDGNATAANIGYIAHQERFCAGTHNVKIDHCAYQVDQDNPLARHSFDIGHNKSIPAKIYGDCWYEGYQGDGTGPRDERRMSSVYVYGGTPGNLGPVAPCVTIHDASGFGGQILVESGAAGVSIVDVQRVVHETQHQDLELPVLTVNGNNTTRVFTDDLQNADSDPFVATVILAGVLPSGADINRSGFVKGACVGGDVWQVPNAWGFGSIIPSPWQGFGGNFPGMHVTSWADGRITGKHPGVARAMGVVGARFKNIIADSASWLLRGQTLDTDQPAPDGSATADVVHSTGTYTSIFPSGLTGDTWEVGGHIFVGGWVNFQDNETAVNAELFLVNTTGVTFNQVAGAASNGSIPCPYAGAGWQYVSGFLTVATVIDSTPNIELEVRCQSGKTIGLWGMTAFYVPLSVEPADAHELLGTQRHQPRYLLPGMAGTMEGVPFVGHGGLCIDSGITKVVGAGSGELTLTGSGTIYEPRYAADGTTILGWVALLQATVNP